MTAYRPPRWLPGGHLQTIFPYFFRRAPLPAYRRERVETPDGDFVDLDWIDGSSSDVPVVVLFHGLEGSSRSHYARAMMHAVARRGWRGVVPHWRGCSGEPNRLPRAYHSGDHAEAGWLLDVVAARTPDSPMFAVGVSLGGSALLNWLGRTGDAAAERVRAAAAVSAPLSLRVGGEAIERGLNMLYTWNFMRTMRRKGLAKARQFPGLVDAERIRRSRTLYEFDEAFTAPLHGFSSADDYWDRGSSLGWLRGIRVATLVLNARNDPFLPLDRLPQPLSLPPAVELEVTEQGGHVGFLHAPRRDERNESDNRAAVAFGDPLWMPLRVLAFFEERLPRVDAAESAASTSTSATPEQRAARAA